VTAAVGGVRLRASAEREVRPEEHRAISALLIDAFPRAAAHFATASWWGARPEYRLWLEEADGTVVAHLDVERRVIGVGDRDVLVAGIGEVATHPARRGQGLGRRLMEELRPVLRRELPVPFGLLACLDEVVGYYERVGWLRLDQPTRFLHPESRTWVGHRGPTLILPAQATVDEWPRDGEIDLRGMPW